MNTTPSPEGREKGLPEYSIKGGVCNEGECLNICTTLVFDGIWRCEPCAKKKVGQFVEAIRSIGLPI